MTVETSPAVILGERISVGLRTYLEITHVSMVEEAEVGQTVYIYVSVRNKYTEAVFATVTVAVNGIEIQGAQATLQPSVEYSWPLMQFTMPNKSVQGTIAAFYYTGLPPPDDWVKDDEKTFSVKLAVPLAGTIVRKELEYDGVQDPIPVRDITQGQRALVHIWGRNDTPVNQKLALSWAIRAPDGVIVEQGSDWETWHTGPGGQHHFIIPPGALDYLNLDKVGTYTIGLALVMNPDNPTIVDEYAGDLCTVVAPPPPVFKGTITKKELEYDGKQAPIPVANVLVGLHGLVHIWGRNDMATNQQLGLSWVIKDPDEIVVEQGTDWSTLAYLPGREHHFILPPGVLDYVNFDKLGNYTMSIELLMNPADPVVVATYDGNLCTVTMEIPPDYELIQDTIYPHAYIYEGEAEIGVATFSLPVGPPPIVDWIGDKITNKLAAEVEKEGSRMLELKVYRSTTVPWVNYRLEATAAVTPQEGIGIAVWPVLAALPWAKIITAAIIAAIIIAVFQLAFLPVLRILFERKPGLSPKVKEKMTRETLISFIMDLRPAYAPEELEGMTDAELREVADTVYQEEVPPAGIKWWQWCIIAGVGIAGGALAFRFISPLLPEKKEE